MTTEMKLICSLMLAMLNGCTDKPKSNAGAKPVAPSVAKTSGIKGYWSASLSGGIDIRIINESEPMLLISSVKPVRSVSCYYEANRYDPVVHYSPSYVVGISSSHMNEWADAWSEWRLLADQKTLPSSLNVMRFSIEAPPQIDLNLVTTIDIEVTVIKNLPSETFGASLRNHISNHPIHLLRE